MSIDETQEKQIFDRLVESPLYQGYLEAFEVGTGFPLIMQFAIGEDWHPCQCGDNANDFCQQINSGSEVCQACVALNQKLYFDAKTTARTAHCFAGLKESAVPVRMGDVTLAFLKTGEVFDSEPNEEGFASVEEVLLGEGRSKESIKKLKDLYFTGPVVDGEQYEGVVALLAFFARQLSQHVDELVLAATGAEPAAVSRARVYIEQNLEDPLSLGDVSGEVGVSEYYFCKLFKKSTGLTFTEYVNRMRIDWAKKELCRPDSRVTEVAFKVGYQSLSQFNRSFSRIVGEAPSQYRQQFREGAAR